MLDFPNQTPATVQNSAQAGPGTNFLYPERSFADALYALWEVDQGIRTMSPEEAHQLWESAKENIDHYKEFEARLESLVEFRAKEIGKIKALLDFTDRYLKQAMRRTEVEVIDGEHYRAILGQNTYYRIIDTPKPEDVAKYPEAVETSFQWKSETPAVTLLSEIAAIIDEAVNSDAAASDAVAAARKKIANILFADRLHWKRSGTHKIIDSIIKSNPLAISRDRYEIKISDTLTVRLKGNGRAKTKSKRIGVAQHSLSAKADGGAQGTNSSSASETHDSRTDDASRPDLSSH